jgi:glycogen operon protein
MLRTTKRVIRLRKEFLAGQPHDYPAHDNQSHFHWFGADGKPMSAEAWNDPGQRVIQLLLGSEAGHINGLVVVNGGADDVKVTLPLPSLGERPGHRLYELRLTTSDLHDRRQGAVVASGERDLVQANTINIYRTDRSPRY